MENKESDRKSKGTRLAVLAEHGGTARENATGTKAGPAVRKLVTFEKLNSVAGPDGGAKALGDADLTSPDDARPRAAGGDEATASQVRGHRGLATTSDLIAARTRQIANLEAIRTCGAKLRRAIDLLS